MAQYKCPQCNNDFGKLISLSLHYRKAHNSTAKILYVELFCNGIAPVCHCGCGEETKFLSIEEGFRVYKLGHASRVSNNFQTEKAKANSLVTRKKMLEDGTWKPFCSNETGTTWNKGLTKLTDERVAALAAATQEPNVKKTRSERFRKLRLDGTVRTLRGPEHSQWNGGTSTLYSVCHANRTLYAEWKYPILLAANFACKECGKKNEKGSSISLHVHHDQIKFATIVHLIAEQNGWELAYGSATPSNNEEIYLLKEKIAKEVADYHIKNSVSGLVLCEDCHKMLHPNLNIKH